jgi:TRAP-type C4-dicarboxylate transport system permease small subunit
MINNRLFSFTKLLSTVAAFWAMFLAFIIIADIIGREVFNFPLPGTIEIVGNSIVSILFLQIPAAVGSNAMLRTTMIYEKYGELGRRWIDAIAMILGIFFFIGVIVGGWGDMIEGWRIREFEGEGSLRVPVYTVRTIIIALGALTVVVYAGVLWRLVAPGGERDRLA